MPRTIPYMARKTTKKNLPARNGDTGRLSLLTQETEDTICRHVAKGNHLIHAAYAAGISERTLYRWLEVADTVEQAMTEGRPYDEGGLRYLQFRQALSDARAKAALHAVQIVQTSMNGGHLIRETPLLNINGDPVRGDDGKILYDRTYSVPDGRLAMTYLGRFAPREWGQNPTTRVELSGPGGGPVSVEHSGDQITSLSARLEQVLREQREAEEEDAAEAHEAELVDDDGMGEGE